MVVDVRAAGLNGADRLQLMGLYPAPIGSPPDIPGLELAGEIISLGPGVERFAVGDRVMAIVGGGAQGERCVVHEDHLLAVPDDVDWPAAGGFTEAFTTAYDAVLVQCMLRAGERLCVHGAAGGVGLAAVQLGVAGGCEVVATVRNPELRRSVAAFGAVVVAPEEFTEHGPFDVILELVGAPNVADDLRSLATGGRISIIGVGAGAKAEVNLLELMAKRARIVGSTLRARSVTEKAAVARAMERDVVPLLRPAPCVCRWRRPSRCATPLRPTSGLLPAASSGRSCWFADPACLSAV